MAFQAKDGSKHTNRDSMKHADAKHSAAQPAHEPQEHEPDQQDPQESQEGEGEMPPNDLMDAFEQHMQQHAAGQTPDPHNAKRLADHFNKFAAQAHGDHDGY